MKYSVSLVISEMKFKLKKFENSYYPSQNGKE